jgi:hypothetical protein
MNRAVPLSLSTVTIVAGLALAAVVALVWLPCAAVADGPGPCTAVASSDHTGWIGALWPVGVAIAVYAGYRALAHSWSAMSIAVVPVLALMVIAANPVVEHTLLTIRSGSWEQPPWTGGMTAALFLLAGVVLASTVPPRVRG